MKKGILFFAVLLFSVNVLLAKSEETVSIRMGGQKTADRGKISIKLVAVEDSRCPKNAKCMWAGSAKVKLVVTRDRESKTIEINTFLEPKEATAFGYRFKIGDVTPWPGDEKGPVTKTARLIISRG